MISVIYSSNIFFLPRVTVSQERDPGSQRGVWSYPGSLQLSSCLSTRVRRERRDLPESVRPAVQVSAWVDMDTQVKVHLRCDPMREFVEMSCMLSVPHKCNILTTFDLRASLSLAVGLTWRTEGSVR